MHLTYLCFLVCNVGQFGYVHACMGSRWHSWTIIDVLCLVKVFLVVTLAHRGDILLVRCIIGISGSLFDLVDDLDQFVACLDVCFDLV